MTPHQTEETRLRFRLGAPVAGWMVCTLTTVDGEVEIVFSQVPCDTLRPLAGAAASFVDTGCRSAVDFSLEPGFLVLTAEREVGELRLQLTLRPESGAQEQTDVRWSWSGDPWAAVLAFWRGLRALEAEWTPDFARDWAHPFPHLAVRQLTELVDARRKER